MKLRQLDMVNFTVHAMTGISFPETGVILVSGPNGGGKSSIVEGVAVGLFGRPLRGASCWREGAAGSVRVVTDQLDVLRGRSAGGKNTLAFSSGGAATEYESASHAQAALTALLGDADVWRRSHVFSSQDAANFTQATDAERKRLLEGILGLDRFDDALVRCRTDLETARRTLDALERETAVLDERASAAQRRVADAEQRLAEDAPAVDPGLPATAEKLSGLFQGCCVEVEEARQRADELQNIALDSVQAVKRLERQLADFEAGVCYACQRPLPPKAKGDAAKVQEQLAAAQARVVLDKTAAADARLETQSLDNDRQAIQAQLAIARATLKTAEDAQKRRQTAETALETLRTEAEQLGVQVDEKSARRAAGALEAATLDAAETALGLRGIRAHVLGQALSGIEAVANSWLAKVATGEVRLILKSYTERKTGGVADVIGLTFEGIGGDGYQSLSGGERRRVDASLAFALAEVAGAATGRPGGLLIADELFDALDSDGIDAVAAVLRELAREHQVLVISHSAELAERLKPTQHWHVAKGTVRVL